MMGRKDGDIQLNEYSSPLHLRPPPPYAIKKWPLGEKFSSILVLQCF